MELATDRFTWERTFWRAGYSLVAGVDEVGRGALAGPLVAAAVILDPCATKRRTTRGKLCAEVRDSKLLDRRCRDRALDVIRRSAIAIGYGVVSNRELDELGLSASNRLAMERAVWNLGDVPGVLLLDACTTDLPMPQVGLIDGDDCCLSISAASIVAKVLRDRMMADLHALDARYGFDRHVGYATPEHLEALERHGPGPMHRRSFRPVRDRFDRPTFDEA